MIQRVLSTLLGVLFLIVVFLFASLLVAIAVTTGLLVAGWMWWRSKKRVAERRPGRGGRVIEGEYRMIDRQ